MCMKKTLKGKAKGFLHSGLSDEYNWTSFIPTHLVTCRGIIRGVVEAISVDKNKLHTRSGDGEVLSIHQFSTKSTNDTGEVLIISTKTVSITFSRKVFPKNILIWDVVQIMRTPAKRNGDKNLNAKIVAKIIFSKCKRLGIY